MRMVAPMVFYPPAFTVLVGEINRCAGATSPFEARMHATRLLPIGCSMATLALIWPVATAIGLPTSAALLGTGFLALYPVGVMLNRLIKEENLVTPLYLLLLWILAGYCRRSGFCRRAAIGAVIVTSVLTKQMGIATVVLAVLVLALKGAWRAAGACVGYGILGVLLFLWYGLAWGGESFLALQKEHLVYATRLDALWPLLAENKVTDAVVGSSWILGLWIAFVLFSLNRRRRRSETLLTIAGVVYLVVLVLCYPPDRNYGWYRLPLLPILALAWGSETAGMFRRYDVVRAVLWVGLFVLPCLDLTGTLDIDRAGGRPLLTTSGPASTEGLNTLPTLTLRIAVAALVLPSLLLLPFPPRARRFLSALLAMALVVAIFWGFAIVSWRWGEIFPPQWGWDPVRMLDLPP
jgi:hypothetical protein